MEENQQQDSQTQTNQPPVINTPSTGVNTTVASDGPNGPFPAELNKFNWGAFLLSWIWSIGNSVWIGLIAIIGGPIGLVMMIILGFKGNEWAWKAKKWNSVEHFKTVQAKWTKWGIIIFVAGIVLSVVFGILFAVMMVSVVKSVPTTINSQQYPGTQTTVNSVDY